MNLLLELLMLPFSLYMVSLFLADLSHLSINMMRVIARTTITKIMDIKMMIVEFKGKFPW